MDPRVRKDLDSLIVPSRQSMVPIAPNFFPEMKGQDGSFAVVGRQAWYDGIVGARAMQAIRCYDIETTLDHKAYCLSASFYDTTIKIYSTHPVMRDGKVVYNTVQVFSRLLQLLDMPRFLPLVNVPQFNPLLLPLKMLLLGLALPLSSPLLSDPTKRYYKSKIIPVKPGGCNQESRPHQRTHHGSGHS